jgi:single-strand DNA-binding protein
MVDLNRVYLGGNLTRNPELRYTPSNTAVTDIGLAVNQTFYDKNREKREETTFVNVEIWGKQAETVCQYLRKGSPVLVEGSLKYDTWEQDGQKRSRIKVRASRVQFLGSGQRSGSGGDSGYESTPAQPQPKTEPPREPAAPSFDDSDEDIPF